MPRRGSSSASLSSCLLMQMVRICMPLACLSLSRTSAVIISHMRIIPLSLSPFSCLLHSPFADIVVATDAGREGELIFRLIYDLAGATAPFQRLWISSQTDKAILDGYERDELYIR